MKTTHLLPRIAAALLLGAMLMCSAPKAQAAEKSLGVSLGYLTKNHSCIGGLHFDYRVARPLRLALDAQYAFRHKGTDAYDFNFNVEVPFTFSRVTVYPLIGLGLWCWNKADYDPVTDDDVTHRDTRMAFNLGAGVDYRIKPSLKLTLRGMSSMMTHHYTTGVIQMGIAFVF